MYLGRTYIALVKQGDIDPIDGMTSDEADQLLVIKKGLKTVLNDAWSPDRLNFVTMGNGMAASS